MTNKPFISIVTPVFNGEEFIAECIDSVLQQDYDNWEYVIVNNCSTDDTLSIISSYAKNEKRIKIIDNIDFVDAETNHNIAFRNISPDSLYCKVVSADDWLLPGCIAKMVDLAVRYPTTGIIGSYQLSGDIIKWQGLPADMEFISGKEAGRRSFLENLNVFGTPTSELYRSDLIRDNDPFFPNTEPYSDTSACFKYLQRCDFGFIHEVLSGERIHGEQLSSRAMRLQMGIIAIIDNLLEYGRYYLTEEEYDFELKKIFNEYYRYLGGCILKLEPPEFWRYHAEKQRQFGRPLSWTKIFRGAIFEISEEIRDPKIAFIKAIEVLKKKISITG
jgi:glycosyltransferase involved in cell wall biosynthesis